MGKVTGELQQARRLQDDKNNENVSLKGDTKSLPGFEEPDFQGQELMTITVKTSECHILEQLQLRTF